MARYKTKWTIEEYNRMLKEGYGQGIGKEYKPWISVYDFSSTGKISRIKGKKIDRIHHVFSKNEKAMLYFSEWDDEVIDIREQYPLLSVNETIDVSEGLGIKHPVDNKTNVARVMTTDFLITKLINGHEVYYAYAIKPLGELDNQRVLDKLKIEEVYWTKRNISWHLITDRDIDWIKFSNIMWFYEAYDVDNLITCMNITEMKEILLSAIEINPDSGVIKIAIELDRHYGVERGNFLILLKHLLAHKVLQCDITKQFSNSIKARELIIDKEKSLC